MNDEKDQEKLLYEFKINFMVRDHMSLGEKLGLHEWLRRKMDEISAELEKAFPGKAFHLTQEHKD